MNIPVRHVRFVPRRGPTKSREGLLIMRAVEAVSGATGEDPAFWERILRWRVRFFRGDLVRALNCRDFDGGSVFEVAREVA